MEQAKPLHHVGRSVQPSTNFLLMVQAFHRSTSTVIDFISSPSIDNFFLYFQAGEKHGGLDPSDGRSKNVLQLLGEVTPGHKPLAEEPKPDETQVSPEASDHGCGKSFQNKEAGPRDWYCSVLM